MPDTPSRVLAYIIRYKADHDGLSPSVREICQATGVKSTSHVCACLDELESRGKIRRAGVRGIAVVGGVWRMKLLKGGAS